MSAQSPPPTSICLSSPSESMPLDYICGYMHISIHLYIIHAVSPCLCLESLKSLSLSLSMTINVSSFSHYLLPWHLWDCFLLFSLSSLLPLRISFPLRGLTPAMVSIFLCGSCMYLFLALGSPIFLFLWLSLWLSPSPQTSVSLLCYDSLCHHLLFLSLR